MKSLGHLQLVDENYQSPFVDAVIRYSSGRFTVDLTRGDVLLETRRGGMSARRDLTLWFQSIDGAAPRIPWSKIASGNEYRARVLMRETFFEARGLN